MHSDSPQDDQPLGLTVHTMPTAAQIAADPVARTRVGRWKMALVLLICAAPVVASYFTYYVVRPEGRRNYGELITPQRPLPDLAGTTLDGSPVSLRVLKDQWLLISVAGGACDAACTNHLYFQRQLREGLGKNKDRLDRVWLVDDAAPVADTLQPALRDSTVIRVPREALAQWLAAQPGKQLEDHLYVVDPMGNWMMRFAAGVDLQTAPKIKKDLEHLMRGSEGWDQAGRP
ncbi:hypothetical protein DIC66_03845 [Rhodoferax lacus]|uniref:Cytochrome C oxidase subunit I n=1 Tax=Rhodoferax lacus TaxID=2184758 RepID=A0A3E1RES3_9BURK|nr:hypothetical protein [Rhodoferax lacus]RFO97869.1 hypothetical protein DIC66_03845 [Rhodoferax lacus]